VGDGDYFLPGFMPVLRSTLQSSSFTQLEHRFMPRAIGTTGLKLTSPIPRNPGGSIENILGAISNYEQGKIASQEAQEQRPVVSAKRYAKTVPVKRNASTVRSSKQQPVSSRRRLSVPNRNG
jgi:hypothetical protein